MSTQTYDSPVPSPDPAVTDAWARRCALAEMGAELAAIGAAAMAASHERLCLRSSGQLSQLHGSMAKRYRRAERIHRTSARLQRAQARRLSGTRPAAVVVPELLAAVARTFCASGATLTLLGAARYEESAVGSDATTTQAQGLEFALGDGPAHTAIGSGRLVMADETTMRARWPFYAAAVAELGVRSVIAAPLCLGDRCLGVLTVFNPISRTVRVKMAGVVRFLLETVVISAEGTLLAVDDRTVVHQASGMLAARLRCPVHDALALLRARAFAENEAISVLARRVVDREVVFE